MLLNIQFTMIFEVCLSLVLLKTVLYVVPGSNLSTCSQLTSFESLTQIIIPPMTSEGIAIISNLIRISKIYVQAVKISFPLVPNCLIAKIRYCENTVSPEVHWVSWYSLVTLNPLLSPMAYTFSI
jgi:hypothetical protein